jgi:hypothetical protein
MWKLSKSIAKELLPAQPIDLVIEPWWGVRFVNFTLEEFKVRFIEVIILVNYVSTLYFLHNKIMDLLCILILIL